MTDPPATDIASILDAAQNMTPQIAALRSEIERERRLPSSRRSPQSPSINRLTSQPETIPSCYRRSRHAEFQQHHGRHLATWVLLLSLSQGIVTLEGFASYQACAKTGSDSPRVDLF